MDTKFFDDLSVTLTKTAKELSEKAEDFYGKQKIRGQILTEEREAEKIFVELGRSVYERYANGTVPEEHALEKLCAEVQNHYDKIAALKETIAERSKKKICPSCGKEMDRDAAFCSACGTAYDQKTEAETADAEVDENIEHQDVSEHVLEEDTDDTKEDTVEEVQAAVEEILEKRAEDSEDTQE